MTHDKTAPPPTRVDVSDLLDAPGATRQVELDVPSPEGFEVPLTELGEEIQVDGALDSLVDGVLLRGTLRVEIGQQCAACLTPIERHEITVEVAEHFSDPAEAENPEDVEEGYAIRDAAIDIDALLRDSLSDAVPSAPHCRPDCAGLCPSCGINRNEGTCDCRDEVVDDRWAALADLDLNN